MATCFKQQSNHGIMGDLHHEEEEDDIDSISSSSSLSNVSSNSSEFMEDATSSSSCGGGSEGLFEMQSLMQQLPFKRGLSRHYQGKSQSFTSLSKVTCLEDLAKSEPPCKKKMKSCKSYGGNLCDTNNKVSHPKTSSRMISKKGSSRGSWSSPLAASKKSSGFLGNRPPMPPQRTSSLFNQTPLFV